MRANRPPRRKTVRTAADAARAPRDALGQWNLRFLAGVIVFGAATIAAILLLMRFGAALPFERVRLAVYAIFILFVACELCAAGALITWWRRRKRR
jgi:Na+-driven multidrug efflux pump